MAFTGKVFLIGGTGIGILFKPDGLNAGSFESQSEAPASRKQIQRPHSGIWPGYQHAIQHFGIVHQTNPYQAPAVVQGPACGHWRVG